MSTRPPRLAPPPASSTPALLGLVAAVWVLGGLWVAVATGAAATGTAGPGNPVVLPVELATGTRPWPGPVATIVAVAEAVLTAVVAVGTGIVQSRWRARRSRVDHAARSLARPGELTSLTERAGRAKARRLAPDLPDMAPPGLPIGCTVPGGVPLFGSWEDVGVVIAGPRTGKTTAICIPMVLDAPGPVLATTTRRDLVDATRGPRAHHGRVWVFDPNAVIGEEPTWWWNPLRTVRSITDARALAGHFADAARPPDAKRDAFFDGEGEETLSAYLLAAALDDRRITDILGWLDTPDDKTAVDVLRRHGQRFVADKLRGVLGSPAKQRGGVLAVARRLVDVLSDPAVHRWVTPDTDANTAVGPMTAPAVTGRAGGRAELYAETVHTGTDTLYLVSREGTGSAAALVAALTAAVVDAGLARAGRSRGGRLPTPLVCVLDEAANVCRIRDLPDQMSYLGGAGILVWVVLQSPAQGSTAWGPTGMTRLWSAANIRVYLGGVGEPRWLEHMAALLGDQRITETGYSHNRRERHATRSTSVRRERILSVADLAALPAGRGILLSSGNRPVLMATTPWWTRADANGVTRSVDQHGPHTHVENRQGRP